MIVKKQKKRTKKESLSYFEATYEKNDNNVNASTVCCHIVLELGDLAPRQGKKGILNKELLLSDLQSYSVLLKNKLFKPCQTHK